MQRSAFIVLEGPDGSGTTSHSRRLADRIALEGKNVLLTAEASDGPVGLWIRSLFEAGTPLSPAAMQLLFCADRADHLQKVVQPALANDTIVVSDRYALSTLAYGEALGLDSQWLADLNKKFVQPDLHLLLLPPLEVCLERLRRRKSTDAYEQQEMQRKVHAAYRRLADNDERIIVIDSSGMEDETAEKVWEAVHTGLLH